MKIFECPSCGQMLFFENTACEQCGSALAFVERTHTLTAVVACEDAVRLTGEEQAAWRHCANRAHGVCNWLVPVDSSAILCTACRLNRTIPGLTSPQRLAWWREIEVAKHRLVYTLLLLGLPLASKMDDPARGLAFDFLDDTASASPVLTGHADGVITLNIREADPAQREQARASMHEPYRTLLGHFRHEIGHYYWDRLVRDDPALIKEFRALFGDEREDYGSALARYYDNGPAPDWALHHISAYCTAHPWEDWAETWAHYLHMLDTLETAHAFGLRIRPKAGPNDLVELKKPVDPFQHEDIASLVEAWLPVTFAVNSLNRSMGQPDLYPFVLSPPAIDKLGFVHHVVKMATMA
jgi:hypothetical protein